MLKIVAEVNGRRMLLLGLDRNNTDRLHQDMPILVDVQGLGLSGDLGGPIQDVMLLAGETLEDCVKQLAPHFPDLENVVGSIDPELLKQKALVLKGPGRR